MSKKKIPLPWSTEPSTADRRCEQTLKFWNLANIWNGRTKSAVTISDAINECNDITKGLDPSTPLSGRINLLRENIVMHGTKSRKLKSQNRTQIIRSKLYVM